MAHLKFSTRRRDAGFTLVEIAVVVIIIGLLCAITLPAYRKIKQRSVNTLISNEIRVAAGALEHFVLEKGHWPSDGAGSWPVEILDYLPPPDRWHKPTPIGGTWAWAINTDDTLASIRVNNFSISSDQITSLDSMIDNGDVATGNLFVKDQALVYVLEK